MKRISGKFMFAVVVMLAAAFGFASNAFANGSSEKSTQTSSSAPAASGPTTITLLIDNQTALQGIKAVAAAAEGNRLAAQATALNQHSGDSLVKTYEGESIRNVAVIGHSHSGKTSLVSALLYTAGGTPRQFQPPVAQRDIEAEVAHCVGGVIADPCGVPLSRSTTLPSGSCIGAFSQRLTYNTTHFWSVLASTALTIRSWSTESKNFWISRSRIQSFFQHRSRHFSTAISGERPGRYP